MTAAATGGHHRRVPADGYGGAPLPPCPPLPPLYPHCMRHHDHRCLYNAQQQQRQQIYRRQTPYAGYPYAVDGHAFPLPAGPPTPGPARKPSSHVVLKVVSEASAEPDKKANFEIVSENVHHGRFRKALPRMPVCLSIILCIVNMLAPGFGTLLAGLTVLCGCETEYNDKCTALMYNLLASILQLMTALIVVGWVWSIMWGITFVSISISKREDEIVAAVL